MSFCARNSYIGVQELPVARLWKHEISFQYREVRFESVMGGE